MKNIALSSTIPDVPSVSRQQHPYIQSGCRKGIAEFVKLYGYINEVPGILLFMFSHGRSGACLRVVVFVLPLAHFSPVDTSRDGEAWFLGRLSLVDSTTLMSYWQLWSLDEPVIQSDLHSRASPEHMRVPL